MEKIWFHLDHREADGGSGVCRLRESGADKHLECEEADKRVPRPPRSGRQMRSELRHSLRLRRSRVEKRQTGFRSDQLGEYGFLSMTDYNSSRVGVVCRVVCCVVFPKLQHGIISKLFELVG